MTSSNRRFRLPAALLLVSAGLALAGCGTSNDEKAAPTGDPAAGAKVDQAAADALPANLKGEALAVGTDSTYPPMESMAADGKTFQGADIDIANAIAKTLGTSVTFQKGIFDNLIPGVQSGKYNMAISSFTDTKEREQKVDFVTYLRVGTSYYTKKGEAEITGPADLCGKTVTVQKGTTQQADVEAQQPKCPSGKPIKLQVFDDQNQVTLWVRSGKADVAMADTPVALDAVNNSKGELAISGKPYATAPYGIAVQKGGGLAEPVQLALKALIASGVYKAILDKWQLTDSAISEPVINGAES